MYFYPDLKELSQYYFTFVFENKIYVALDEDDEKVCKRVTFHPLYGYRCQAGSVSDAVLQAADKIFSMSLRFPERYRMAGEHYVVTELLDGERIRYRIQKETSLLRRAKSYCAPMLSKFFLILLLDTLILWVFGDSMIRWFSVLFPSLNYATLQTTIFLIQIVLTAVFTLVLSEYSFWMTALYSLIPALSIVTLGFFAYKNLLWICCVYLCLILLVTLFVIFTKDESKWFSRLQRMQAVIGYSFLIMCAAISLIVTAYSVDPYTYQSQNAASVETTHDVLTQRHETVCEELQKESFVDLEPQEKLDILQAVCDYECIVILGCDSPQVCAEWIEEDHVLGHYLLGKETIVIDMPCLMDYEASALVSVLLHELRHHYQYRVAQIYDTVAPHLTQANQNLDFIRQARDFKLNQMDYKDYSTDGKEAYRNQCIEKDSRDYADKRMDEYYRYIFNDRF